MLYNYHNHTPRCNHATGEPREYIENAIKGGIKHFGFSEHAPFMFPDGYESWYKLPCSEVSDYFNELYALREEYNDRIDIKIGFEMEYYPQFFDEMYNYAKECGAEYLILGQHYLYGEGPDGIDTFRASGDEKLLKDYTDYVLSAMKTGVFTYVAHPDVFTFLGDSEIYLNEMRKICELSKEMDIPLEINLNGMYYNRSYPKEIFWEMAGNVGCPVVIGGDAHSADRACDMVSFEKAMAMVEKYKLNLIEKPEIIGLK